MVWTEKKWFPGDSAPKWKLVIQFAFSSFILFNNKKKNKTVIQLEWQHWCMRMHVFQLYGMSNGALLICRATLLLSDGKSQAIYVLHARIFRELCTIAASSKHTYTRFVSCWLMVLKLMQDSLSCDTTNNGNSVIIFYVRYCVLRHFQPWQFVYILCRRRWNVRMNCFLLYSLWKTEINLALLI